MKSILSFFIACILVSGINAQSEKYTSTMQGLVNAVDTTRSYAGLMTLANSFERIGNAEKTQWLPFYYAALSNINAAMTFAMDGSFGDKSADMDPLADKAEELLNKAEAINKNNSEIWIVRKLIASGRMMGNAMARYQQYGPLAAAALETAKKLNPENPRVYLLEGQDLYFTPEQFGGDKAEAKKRFEMALSKFNSYQPESTIHPSWGKPAAQYFMSL